MKDLYIIMAILVYKAFVICASLWAITNISGWFVFLLLFAFIGYNDRDYDIQEEPTSREEV